MRLKNGKYVGKKMTWKCGECGFKAKSPHALRNHIGVVHPHPAPNIIPDEVCVAGTIIIYGRKLLDGKYLDVGDVFYRIEKCVVLKTVKNNDSKNIIVDYRITKQNWQDSKPQ